MSTSKNKTNAILEAQGSSYNPNAFGGTNNTARGYRSNTNSHARQDVLRYNSGVVLNAVEQIKGLAESSANKILNQTVADYAKEAGYNSTIAMMLENNLEQSEEHLTNNILSASFALVRGDANYRNMDINNEKINASINARHNSYYGNKDIYYDPKSTKEQKVASSHAMTTGLREYKLNEKMQAVSNLIMSYAQGYPTGAFDGFDKIANIVKGAIINPNDLSGVASTSTSSSDDSYIYKTRVNAATKLLELYATSEGKTRLDSMYKDNPKILQEKLKSAVNTVSSGFDTDNGTIRYR